MAMRCPFHEGDDTPSFIVTPSKNVWHCFGCQSGGTVIDWVMRTRSVSFRHAVALLSGESPALAAPASRSVRSVAPAFALPADADQAVADARLLCEVIAEYHATLKQSPEALAYLAKRGLNHPALVDTFQLGYANRTLGYRLPEKNRLSGAALRGALQRIGILRASGHEHFNGSLVVPVMGTAGEVAEVYGRKIGTNLRPGTALHLYLPGPHRDVFNTAGLVGQSEVILCEALLDALTFWCAGFRNVASAFGVSGFTDALLAALVAQGVRRVLIAYDRDEAGDTAAAKLAPRLIEHGIAPWRVLFPKGMDANAYALKVTPAAKSLALVLERAEPMSASAASRTTTHAAAAAIDPAAATPDAKAVSREESTTPAAPPANDAAAAPLALPSLAAAVIETAPSPAPLPAAPSTAPREIVHAFGDRRYRVRGLDKNLSYEVLKVNVMVSASAHLHVGHSRHPASRDTSASLHIDTLDLYQAKARGAFVKQAAVELGVEESVIARDLAQLLILLEQAQEAAIQASLKPSVSIAEPLSVEQHDAAMALLRDPKLIERIVADVEAIGVVGEASNALVGYLACVSRKLDKPLAVLIQSTSAAGKSTLMDALLSLMPEAERVHYSAMTGQSLFYLGEGDLKHKILAIAEEEGVRQASYALKLLQSQGELSIASTGKDPATGKLVTEEYRVEGPVMLFLTTTAIEIDEELLNRCLVLTINESREQTQAIQARQRTRRTLEGLLAQAHGDAVLDLHRAAQRLLRPLAVVNPYADRLTFASEQVRMRRDHQKYLALIDAIALLHQHQRPVKRVGSRATGDGREIEYVEATLADIALANRLAHEVLGRSLDELPPQTRRVLSLIQTRVQERATTQVLALGAVRFTRRELRAVLGMSERQVRVHVDRLVELDYLLPHAGRNGQRFVYELMFDGDSEADARRLIGLTEVDGLHLVGSKTDLVGGSWPARGDLVASALAAKPPLPAGAGADLPSLVAASEEAAVPGMPRATRSYPCNGSAQPP
ncbi:MAG: toprim domain-containing protein [Pseudomonadota bacterium]